MHKLTQQAVLRIMAWIGIGMAAVTVLLRAWLMPTLRDAETGLFSSAVPVVVLMLASLVVLAGLGFSQRHGRREIAAPAGQRTGVAVILSGAVLTLSGLWDSWLWLVDTQMPPPQTVDTSGIGVIALWLQLIFGVLGGVALVRLGLLMVAEGSTRRGIAGWSMLAPVLWMWFRLARYEMSYVSTVRLSESFFDFVLFILELLFLFRLARYTAGVGKVGAGSLQFYACATALFALSGPLTRLAMYLLGDSEAYLASELAGVADVAVGALAAAVAFGLSTVPAEDEEATAAEEPPHGESSDSPEAEGTASPADDNGFDFIIDE